MRVALAVVLACVVVAAGCDRVEEPCVKDGVRSVAVGNAAHLFLVDEPQVMICCDPISRHCWSPVVRTDAKDGAK